MTETLSALVSIPTVNPPGKSYRRCVNYLSQRLKEWQISHEVIPVSSGRYPRFCILGGIGEGQNVLHFHGHYDVVPAHTDEQFHPQILGECLYGRGSSDMKGGLVAILYVLKFFQKYLARLNGRISFSFVPDEESGSRLGTQHLLRSGLLPRASLGMLMPEPTSGVVWNANKGALTYHIEIRGKPAHVALEHQGENAFESMVEVVRSLLALKKTISKRKTAYPVNPAEANRSVMLTCPSAFRSAFEGAYPCATDCFHRARISSRSPCPTNPSWFRSTRSRPGAETSVGKEPIRLLRPSSIDIACVTTSDRPLLSGQLGSIPANPTPSAHISHSESPFPAGPLSTACRITEQPRNPS